MPDMRYFNAKDKFIEYAYDVFKAYFPDKAEFARQFEALTSDEVKNHFLHITSFYKLLVRDGKFVCTDSNLPEYTDYIDETYRYVALVSLIEALYTTDEYKDFFEWLKAKAKVDTLSIHNAQDLEALYATYNQEHGATQNAIRFFSSLPSFAQRPILAGVTVGQDKKPIDYLAKLLYRMRSKFLHEAKLILELGEGAIYKGDKGKIVVTTLTLEDLQTVFEVGVLTYFGFAPPQGFG